MAEKLSAWLTEDHTERRAQRASRERFEAALARVPDAPPEDCDRM